MSQILTIALREITRLRNRFSSGSSSIIVLLLLGALGLAAFTFRDATSLGSGLYRIGVSGDVPTIHDSRFTMMAVEVTAGQTMLDQRQIDVWVNGAQVLYRPDDKSQYAVSALKKYLEKEELLRINGKYQYQLAFPLRVGVNYLESGGDNQAAATTTSDNAPDAEVIIPSLTEPPAPFTQVIVALLYVLPVTFISIFFTSSFMDEKANRRLTILMSTPVTPFQIIVGKMLPYAIFSLFAIAAIAALTHANILLALAIYAPTTLFIFAIYLMVPLFYRTFKDTTFISMMVTTLTTAYLVFPAMFTGLTDMAFMSPLTLAVKMYRGEAFGWREYLFPSLPMAAIFGLSMYAGTRMLNEEFLMGYRSLTRKLADAVFLMINHIRSYLAIPLLSLIFIPLVYMAQLVILAIATNLPAGAMLASTLILAALIEEVIKSMGIAVLVERKREHSVGRLLLLAFLSALGFLVGEKLLLFFSVTLVSNASLSNALFSSGGLLVVPLVAHFIFTSIVTLLYSKARFRYPWALLVSTIIHSIYNYLLAGGGLR